MRLGAYGDSTPQHRTQHRHDCYGNKIWGALHPLTNILLDSTWSNEVLHAINGVNPISVGFLPVGQRQLIHVLHLQVRHQSTGPLTVHARGFRKSNTMGILARHRSVTSMKQS